MKIKVTDELSQNILDIEADGSSQFIKNILLLAHPIGSYYWSDQDTNPADLFGGTWEQIKDKFIIAVGDSHEVNTSYGSNVKDLSHTHTSAAHAHTTGNHTLTLNETPEHKHNLIHTGRLLYWDSGLTGMGYPNYNGATPIQTTWDCYTNTAGGSQAHNHGDTGSTTPEPTGKSLSETFDITPSCVAAYCWKRIK